MMKLRKAKNLVVANTDKINAVMVVQKEDYIKWTKGHMKKSAKPISSLRLSEVKEAAERLLS